MQTIEEYAFDFAKKHHARQKYNDEPYINHVIRVQENIHKLKLPIEYDVVAYLHDVVEDCDVSLSDIKEIFGLKVSSAVDAITHRTTESYQDYIFRCSENKIARAVKTVDLIENLKHCVGYDNKDRLRVRYELALFQLANNFNFSR